MGLCFSQPQQTMKLIKLLRNWTLPVSMFLGISGYLLFAYVPIFSGVAHVFTPICEAFLPFFMSIILYITFCKVDFRKLIPTKWHVIVSVIHSLTVFSIVGFCLLFRLSGNTLILTEATLACIIAPTAAASAIVTQKLGGSLEEMTTYTFLSNLLCAVLIPLVFPLIEPSLSVDFISASLSILYRVGAVLLLPMALAYFTKHMRALHKFYLWLTSIKNLAFYFWAILLMFVTGTTVKNIMHSETTLSLLLLIAFSGLVVCIFQFAVGRYAGRFFHHQVEAGQALGQKNTSFALWIAGAYLHPLATVGPGCYILWQNIVNSIEIWHYERHTPTK